MAVVAMDKYCCRMFGLNSNPHSQYSFFNILNLNFLIHSSLKTRLLHSVLLISKETISRAKN